MARSFRLTTVISGMLINAVIAGGWLIVGMLTVAHPMRLGPADERGGRGTAGLHVVALPTVVAQLDGGAGFQRLDAYVSCAKLSGC